ncbi:MAG: DUF3459 domain-containing protein, partial [Parachlamydiaceae bacterium]|nr:DUF3459 domain-containing protein [Parachlamydiaceae bacterium]
MKLPIGPIFRSSGTHFRVYASFATKVDVILIDNRENSTRFPLNDEGNGYFSGFFREFKNLSRYYFSVDEGPFYADPVSNFQPEGPFGPSQIIDHQIFKWNDQEWKGTAIEGQIIYEMHIGTFTQEGTYSAAELQLPELAKLGVTILEIMPLNDFSGKFGWGYDGVNLFAPTRLYGTPDQLKSFINTAHQLNLAVILDVVYNHFGPEGNFIDKFSPDYFNEEETDWGRGIDFSKTSTREFFLTNIRYWLEIFHFDGFRFDALQSIDYQTTPILKEIRKLIRKYEGKRTILLIGENESQDANLIRSIKDKGFGLDALWNDDFHHSARVCLTGRKEGYFKDYTGSAQEFISLIKRGFLYQGQFYTWQKKFRGTPSLDMRCSAYILFLQNHDQIANSPQSLRIHQLTDQNKLRAMNCLMFLSPNIPMLFQGQEFNSSSPFYYFADHSDRLMRYVSLGRKEFLCQFRSQANAEVQKNILNPSNPAAFIKSKLDFTERELNKSIYNFYKDLIKLRRFDKVFSDSNNSVDGAVLNMNAFVLRFFGDNDERLVLLNFSTDFEINPASEPLLVPPENTKWQLLFSSDALAYGGQGTP